MKIAQKKRQVEFKVWYRRRGCVCVWIKTGLGSAGLVPTDCLKWGNRFKAGSGCWQVELCAAIFPIPFRCVVHMNAAPCQSLFTCNQKQCTCSNQGEWFMVIDDDDDDDTTVWLVVSRRVAESIRHVGLWWKVRRCLCTDCLRIYYVSWMFFLPRFFCLWLH